MKDNVTLELFDQDTIVAPSLSTTKTRFTEGKKRLLLSVAMKGQLIKKRRVGTEAQQNAQISSKQMLNLGFDREGSLVCVRTCTFRNGAKTAYLLMGKWSI